MEEGIFGLIVGAITGAWFSFLFTYTAIQDDAADECARSGHFIYAHQKYECRATGEWTEK